MTDPCRWSSRSRFLLRECLVQAPSPSCSSHHPWPEEHGSWAQLEQQRNTGIAECSIQAGNHENMIVRAVLMTEWLSQADVVRSINMLRVWLSVGGCDVPADDADTQAHMCGHSGKVHGAQADRSQLVLKKFCSQAHQSFTFASDEAFPKVVYEAIAENLGVCHQDEKFKKTPLWSNCAVMLQPAWEKNSKKKTPTQRLHPLPQLTVKTYTHPCDRNMDVGTCLPDNSARSFPTVTRPHKSLPIQFKLYVNFVAKQMRPRLSLEHLPPRVGRQPRSTKTHAC